MILLGIDPFIINWIFRFCYWSASIFPLDIYVFLIICQEYPDSTTESYNSF